MIILPEMSRVRVRSLGEKLSHSLFHFYHALRVSSTFGKGRFNSNGSESFTHGSKVCPHQAAMINALYLLRVLFHSTLLIFVDLCSEKNHPMIEYSRDRLILTKPRIPALRATIIDYSQALRPRHWLKSWNGLCCWDSFAHFTDLILRLIYHGDRPVMAKSILTGSWRMRYPSGTSKRSD